MLLDRLSNNRNIIIKPADKGEATVILNTTDYLQEAKRQLDNDTYYKRIEEDCTSGHEQTINHCIDDLVKNGEIQHDVAKLLKPAQSRTPIFYMLPKIHKINNPGRPVISFVNSHTEKISAYVDKFLRPIAELLPSYIRDTTDFIQRIKVLANILSRSRGQQWEPELHPTSQMSIWEDSKKTLYTKQSGPTTL